MAGYGDELTSLILAGFAYIHVTVIIVTQVNIWRYGDFTPDDCLEFGYQK